MGPFDKGEVMRIGPDGKPENNGGDCFGCSTEHVEEFGNCEGVVLGQTDYGTQQGPEVDVRWEPSKLRYAYDPNDLVII